MSRTARAALLVTVLLAAGSTSAAPAAEAQLPNLVPVAPTILDFAPADDPADGLALRFDTTTYNRGAYALDLLGLPPKSLDRAAAQQCVAWAAAVCIERREAGDFVWHPAHGHWHFEDYARYELRLLDENQQPDMTPEGLVAGGQKVTFCLADIDAPDDHAGPPIGFYTGVCPGVIQGISAGWADTYSRSLPGQQILLAGVSRGTYALVITIDPDERLAEISDADNVAWTIVDLPFLD